MPKPNNYAKAQGLLTKGAVCKILGNLTYPTFRQLEQDGTFPAPDIKMGKSFFYSKKWLKKAQSKLPKGDK